MTSKTEILYPETFYHIYNRANGNEKLFKNEEHYRFFLQQYQLHLSDYVDTFCYCLMPNHFHLLVRIKTEEVILKAAESEKKTFPKFGTLEKLKAKQTPPPAVPKLISKGFSNFFSSYTQAYNKQQGRMGSLFMKNFKRKLVEDSSYLKKLICYIHQNPVEAGLCHEAEGWPHSSYHIICKNKNSFICTPETIEWFEDLQNFKAMHKTNTLQLNEYD